MIVVVLSTINTCGARYALNVCEQHSVAENSNNNNNNTRSHTHFALGNAHSICTQYVLSVCRRKRNLAPKKIARQPNRDRERIESLEHRPSFFVSHTPFPI